MKKTRVKLQLNMMTQEGDDLTEEEIRGFVQRLEAMACIMSSKRPGRMCELKIIELPNLGIKEEEDGH